MKNIHAIIIIAIALVLNSCGSVYKKHYGNGFTFIKHNKKENPIKSNKNKDLQEHSIALLNDDIKKEMIRRLVRDHKQLVREKASNEATFSHLGFDMLYERISIITRMYDNEVVPNINLYYNKRRACVELAKKLT